MNPGLLALVLTVFLRIAKNFWPQLLSMKNQLYMGHVIRNLFICRIMQLLISETHNNLLR